MRQRGADPGIGHSPRGRRCEHPSPGDHPQNWRATSQRPAGRRYAFNTDGVLALLWPFAYVYPVGDFLVYVSAVLYAFACFLIFRGVPRVFGFPRASLCTLVWNIRVNFWDLLLRSVSVPRSLFAHIPRFSARLLHVDVHRSGRSRCPSSSDTGTDAVGLRCLPFP